MTVSLISAGIAWDPHIQGLLAFLVGVVVLCGSVYLLLATNIANRLGFLVALTGLMGWMVIMGLIWWIYGIGWVGQSPAWEVREVNFGAIEEAATQPADELDTAALPADPEQILGLDPEAFARARAEIEPTLGGWELLPEGDLVFAEASAAAGAFLTENPLRGLGAQGVDGPEDVVTLWVFQRGGETDLDEDPTTLERIGLWFRNTFIEIRSPTKYAIVQMRPVIPEEPQPGQPPPTPRPDPAQPVVSLILIRDLGNLRLPPAMLTIFSAIVFGLLCHMLHRRDLRVAEVRGLLPATRDS